MNTPESLRPAAARTPDARAPIPAGPISPGAPGPRGGGEPFAAEHLRVCGRADVLFEGFRVRPVRAGDAAAVRELIEQVYSEYDIPFELDGYDRDLRDPGATYRARGGEFWVVERDGRIVATVAVLVHDGGGARLGELKRLYVERAARGYGLGRRLTRMAIDYARACVCTRFCAWSDTCLRHAHAMYLAMGFTQDGERPVEEGSASREFGFWLTL